MLLYPHQAQSLNMIQPFAPVETRWTAFSKSDQAFLRTPGIEEESLADIAASGTAAWSGVNGYGRKVTVIFCGSCGEYGFLFVQNNAGVEYLTDVLLDCYGLEATANLATMDNGLNYLLTEAWAHGSVSERWWTRWYNPAARRMELRYLRRGTEAICQGAAQAVTITSLDGGLQQAAAPCANPYLVTCTYAALVTYRDAQPPNLTPGGAECTVRVYQAAADGMQLIRERLFAGASPAILQTLSAEALLDDSWDLSQSASAVAPRGRIGKGPPDSRRAFPCQRLSPCGLSNTQSESARRPAPPQAPSAADPSTAPPRDRRRICPPGSGCI